MRGRRTLELVGSRERVQLARQIAQPRQILLVHVAVGRIELGGTYTVARGRFDSHVAAVERLADRGGTVAEAALVLGRWGYRLARGEVITKYLSRYDSAAMVVRP